MKAKTLLLILGMLAISTLTWQCKRSVSSSMDDYFDTASDLARVSDVENENWKYIEGEYITNDYIERSGNTCPETYWMGDTLLVQFGDNGIPCVDSRGRRLAGAFYAIHNGQAGPGMTIRFATVMRDTVRDEENPFSLVDFMRSTATYQDHGNDNDGNPVSLFNWDKEIYYKYAHRETHIIQNILLKATRTSAGSYYEYTGDGSGSSGNLNFTFRIIEALEVLPVCGEIVKGKINVEFRDGTKALIDFGSGECDGKVKIEIEGQEKIYDLNTDKIAFMKNS